MPMQGAEVAHGERGAENLLRWKGAERGKRQEKSHRARGRIRVPGGVGL